jgi:hypothetical protein
LDDIVFKNKRRQKSLGVEKFYEEYWENAKFNSNNESTGRHCSSEMG